MPRQNRYASRSAWEDRWSKPKAENLLATLKSFHRKVLSQIQTPLEEASDTAMELRWLGDGWKWSMVFRQVDGRGRDVQDLCYLVPDPEGPLVCVPLTDAQVEALPLKRLPRQVREGIKSASCGLRVHYAAWRPTSQAETQNLLELLDLKRTLTSKDQVAAA